MSATGKQPNTSWQYLNVVTGIYHKNFPVVIIYDKLQGINLDASKWANINAIIYNGEAFGIK